MNYNELRLPDRESGVGDVRPSCLSMIQSTGPMRRDRLEAGVLGQCLEAGITLGPGPLAVDLLGGGGSVDPKTRRACGLCAFLARVVVMAKRDGVSHAVLAIARRLTHLACIIPVVGSANRVQIQDAMKADGLEPSREESYSTLMAARMQVLP